MLSNTRCPAYSLEPRARPPEIPKTDPSPLNADAQDPKRKEEGKRGNKKSGTGVCSFLLFLLLLQRSLLICESEIAMAEKYLSSFMFVYIDYIFVIFLDFPPLIRCKTPLYRVVPCRPKVECQQLMTASPTPARSESF